MSRRRSIQVDFLARVEGEGGLEIRLNGDQVTSVKVNIFEPPRFFEAFLRGRGFNEVPDITARICGICPVAYQMSSVQAMEQILGVQVDPAVRDLRRLLYCGEWIESHALHIYLLHAPDFLGYSDGLAMARDHAETVVKGLALKKTGNDLMALIGGREIHPISICVGGMYRVPTRDELCSQIDALRRSYEIAVETVEFVRGLSYPEFEQDYEFVALTHPTEYAIDQGRLISSNGLDIGIEEYADHFTEQHLAHSNALHSTTHGRPYLVGPLARFNLNFDRLPENIRALALANEIVPPLRNPFRGIQVRAIETVYACQEALRIIENYKPPAKPRVEVQPKRGVGHGCTEAPRGILYHRYELDDAGTVRAARIVPPTAQNLEQMEDDLRELVPRMLHLPPEELELRCEQCVRNYDPCISCATHFLRLKIVQTADESR